MSGLPDLIGGVYAHTGGGNSHARASLRLRHLPLTLSEDMKWGGGPGGAAREKDLTVRGGNCRFSSFILASKFIAFRGTSGVRRKNDESGSFFFCGIKLSVDIR